MNKKAYTLIELLAVIIIISLISVIIVPKINTTIKNAQKNIYESSAAALEREADVFYTHKKMNQERFNGCEYNFQTGNNTCEGFEFKGQKPDSGTLKIYSNGDIAYSLQFNNYCYSKKPKSDTIVKSSDCSKTLLDAPTTVTTGDGLYVSTLEPGRFVYRGANPNNYITLNEGTASAPSNVNYRIISFENDGTIKVIRDEKLSTNLAWDEATARQNTASGYYCTSDKGCNVWGNLSNTFYNGATLGDIFNYKYYANNTNTELTNSINTGTVTVDSTLNQYLNSTWITDKEMSKYIDNHDFNVGGVCYYSGYTGGDKGLQKEESEEKTMTWNGKIGLLNITEYIESSTNSSCTDVWSNYYSNEDNESKKTSNEWPCKYENYNYKSSYSQWTLSPASYTISNVWRMHQTGYFYGHGGAYELTEVRPVFYLKSSTIITGSGTQADPYYIIE